jgi:hypothetical protein
MPGRGPAPKAQRSRPNDTARRAAEMRKLAADGQLRGPDLPEGMEWHPRTLAWWATWRTSAQATTFTDTDWDFLLDTAMLHNEMWAGNPGLAAELRLRVSKFGASPEDRLRLRMVVDDEVSEVKTRTRVTSARRERLLSVVNEQ